jgi:phage gp36-like protein
MQVITIEELQGVIAAEKIIELTNDLGGETIDAANLTEAERSALSDIYLYTDKFYPNRFATPYPDTLKELVRQLTKCHLYFRRDAVPKEISELYSKQLGKLKGINDMSFGAAKLDESANQEPRVGISVSASPQRFKDNFTGFNN